MNAHINYDLPQALLAVITDQEFADPALLARREADHRAIDEVLAARVGAEGDELASVSGPASTLDRLLRAAQPPGHPAVPARGAGEGVGQRGRPQPGPRERAAGVRDRP